MTWCSKLQFFSTCLSWYTIECCVLNYLNSLCYLSYREKGSFPFVPPSLVGAYYLHPPDARAIFLHSNLLCNGTCSVTGGRITYWGGTNGKDPREVLNERCFIMKISMPNLL